MTTIDLGANGVILAEPKNTIHLILFVAHTNGAELELANTIEQAINSDIRAIALNGSDYKSFRAGYTIHRLNKATRIEITDNNNIPQVYEGIKKLDGVRSLRYIVYSEEFCSVLTNDIDHEYIAKPQDIGLSSEYVIEFDENPVFPTADELSAP